MALEPEPLTLNEAPTENWWDDYDATCVTPEARAAVPEMPPVPPVTTFDHPTDNWVWTHCENGHHRAQEERPAPQREVVTEENPLQIDVFYSMRSPYSYLSLFRLVYLNSNYNVDVDVKVIFPIAVRTSDSAGSGGASSLAGRWYYYWYSIMDAPRSALYEGVPFRYANPDPIVNDTWPPGASQAVAPMEAQPYIAWLVRLAMAATRVGKALEYCFAVSPLIWGARTPIGEWPLHVKAAVDGIGMDYDAVIADIQADPEPYDQIWLRHQDEFQATGQGGVPTMSFNGEPFFGQDRFNQLFWRLRQNGLTARKEPRAPFVARPLRWPVASGLE